MPPCVDNSIDSLRAWLRPPVPMLSVHFVVVSIASVVFIAVNIHVSQKAPEPYMDEVFHVPQTQAYCSGRLDIWDPKITTFPGFHLLAAIWGKMLHCLGLFGSRVCPPRDLRFMNALFAIANVLLASSLHRSIHAHSRHPPSQATALLTGLTLASTPLHFFFSTLLYTDVSSLTFVLACHLSLANGRPYIACVLGTIAVTIRQTNAVWVCFGMLDSMLRFLQIDGDFAGSGQRPSIPKQITTVLRKAFTLRVGLLKNFWPIALVPMGFAIFVVHNGGIVVGDKQAHKPVVHTAQFGYFFLFLLGCLCPVLLHPKRCQQTLTRAAQHPFISLFLMVPMFGAMYKGVVIHPYLIADNRHYTFYIWRRFLSKEWLRACLVPFAWFGASVVGGELLATHSIVWLIGFMACVGATIVPAGLLEFRYFLVPVAVVFLHIKPRTKTELITALTLSMCVNTATLVLFLEKPFLWPDGTIARFMW